MTVIQIIHLVSGEHLISKIQEVKEGDESLCLNLVMPMSIAMDTPVKREEKPTISFYPYSPFSSSPEFKIAFDKVVSVGNPSKLILEKYIDVVQPTYPVLTAEELDQHIKERERKND